MLEPESKSEVELSPYSKEECIALMDKLSRHQKIRSAEKDLLSKRIESNASEFCFELLGLFKKRYQNYLKNIQLQFKFALRQPLEISEDMAIDYIYSKLAQKDRYTGLFVLMHLFSESNAMALGYRSLYPRIQARGLPLDPLVTAFIKLNGVAFMAVVPVYQLYKELGFGTLCRLNVTSGNQLVSPHLMAGFAAQYLIDVHVTELSKTEDIESNAGFERIFSDKTCFRYIEASILSFSNYLQHEVLENAYASFFKSFDPGVVTHGELIHWLKPKMNTKEYQMSKAEDRMSLISFFCLGFHDKGSSTYFCRQINHIIHRKILNYEQNMGLIFRPALSFLNYFPESEMHSDEVLERTRQMSETLINNKKSGLALRRREVESSYQQRIAELGAMEMNLTERKNQAQQELRDQHAAHVQGIEHIASERSKQIRRTFVPSQTRYSLGISAGEFRDSDGRITSGCKLTR